MRNTLLSIRSNSVLLVILFALPMSASYGQTAREEAKKLQRPKDCGIVDYDAFKNASFNLLGEVKKTDLNYETVKTDIEGYLSGDQQPNIDGVKSDIKRMKAILNSVKKMDDRVKQLTAEGNDLLQNVKDVKPVTKVKAATSNTKTSIRAVDLSKDLMKEITGAVTADTEKLVKKVTDLGGTVKDEEE